MSFAVYVTYEQHEEIENLKAAAIERLEKGEPQDDVVNELRSTLASWIGEEKADLLLSGRGHLCVPGGAGKPA